MPARWGRALFRFTAGVVLLRPHAVLGVRSLEPSSLGGRMSPCGFWWGHRLCSHFPSAWLSFCRNSAVHAFLVDTSVSFITDSL